MYSQFNVKEKFLEEYNWSYEGRVNDDSETKIRKWKKTAKRGEKGCVLAKLIISNGEKSEWCHEFYSW